MAMCLPSIIATGAPTKTSQTIEYFAISSDQVRESFKTYLKNTLAETINAIDTTKKIVAPLHNAINGFKKISRNDIMIIIKFIIL